MMAEDGEEARTDAYADRQTYTHAHTNTEKIDLVRQKNDYHLKKIRNERNYRIYNKQEVILFSCC